MRRRWSVVVGALAVLALAGCGGDDKGEERPTTVEAVFDEALPPLHRGDPVRLAGLDVGEVAGVRREGGATIVSMRQKPRGPSEEWVGVGSRAEAKIRPRIFREGRHFIDVQPFTRSGPFLRDGDRIPPSRTDVPTVYGDLLRALEGPCPDERTLDALNEGDVERAEAARDRCLREQRKRGR
jgi:ABC-type transporter Mla subunit MlaD